MAEGCVAKVMTQGNCFGKHFIKLESFGHCSGDLGNFKGVGETGPVVITGGREEYLCLVLETPEGLSVYDPIPVPLESSSDFTRSLGDQSTPALTAKGGVRRERSSLLFFKAFPNRHVCTVQERRGIFNTLRHGILLQFSWRRGSKDARGRGLKFPPANWREPSTLRDTAIF
jgi:hypothetical protein